MISGKILRDAIISGANNINNQRSRVDELNVFPVPDGDTGTNMGMTVGAAVRELQMPSPPEMVPFPPLAVTVLPPEMVTPPATSG